MNRPYTRPPLRETWLDRALMILALGAVSFVSITAIAVWIGGLL